MIRIANIKLSLDECISSDQEIKNLKNYVVKHYKIPLQQILQLTIFKKAVDARQKSNVHFVFTVDLSVIDEKTILLKKDKNISIAYKEEYLDVKKGVKRMSNRPVIIGFGPSGIFSALILSRKGYNPIVLERGYDVDKRTQEWDAFLSNRTFNENASVLFGEGGAGTFSDGKLTTSVKNVRNRFVLEELIKAGADPKILYTNKPHVGTDLLKIVIKNIRQEIIENGGDVRFTSKVTDFEVVDNQLQAVIVNEVVRIPTNVCLLGIGHSARDTFEVLLEKGLYITQKPFSVGVRIEHTQEMINKSQYGSFYNHKALGAAEYKLSYHSKSGRSAYTFCMCPGGYVVNSTSEENTVVTNGMSYHARDGINANSALLVNVTPEDFPSSHPLAGIEFQRTFEKRAYELMSEKYNNPVQLVGDFLSDQYSTGIGKVVPTITPGYEFAKFQDIYPKYITDTLKEALHVFERKIKGFASKDAVLTGPETRSSSPVRIPRDDTYQANIKGLYPIGEGPGHAGGIMSAAIDGIKAAEEVIKEYTNI